MYRTLVLSGLALILNLFAMAQGSTDTILYNGVLFIGPGKRAEALAIRDDRIVAVGTSAQVRKLAGTGTKLIDVGGRTVVPGFNDAHTHLELPPVGLRLSFPSIEPTWDDVVAGIEAAVKTTRAKSWIAGTIGGTAMGDPRAIRASLDKIAPDHPVMLTTFYGHGKIFNSSAMAELKLADKQKDPAGGHFERDATGMLNGRAFEYAQWRLDRQISASIPDAKIEEAFRELTNEAIGYGVTSIQLMTPLPVDRAAKIARAADLPIRIRLIPLSMTTDRGRDLSEIASIKRLKLTGSKVSVSGIKWILDGTPFERGAALRGSYADAPDQKGRLNFSEREIEKIVAEALRFDQQLLLHAVGDRTVEAVLNKLEKAGGKVDWRSKRPRIEHGEGVTDELVLRAKKLGVIVVQNPTHFSFVDMLYARWSPKLTFSAQRSLIDAGIPYALGSDGPLNPGLNVMLASIHPSRPSEAISRDEAVAAYTAVSAFAEFSEKTKGTIAAGMLADIAVLSQDIFAVPPDALPGTKSVLTLVGGKIVHRDNLFR